MVIDCHLHIGYEKDFDDQQETRKLFWKRLYVEFEKRYNFNTDALFDQTVDGQVAIMNELGIDRSFLIGCDAETTVGAGFEISMEGISNMVKRYPDRFIGVPCIDPLRGLWKSLDNIQRAKDLGNAGVKFFPCWGWDPTDMKYDPLYRKLYDLSMFFVMHVGSQIAPRTRLKYTSPLMIDEIAYRFPELRIIETHLGWPWIGDALIVARKNENVYCDFSGLVPRIHIGEQLDHTANVGTYRMAERQLPEKLLYGSDAPHGSQKDILNMVNDLPIMEKTKKMWLGENALKFLDLGY